MNNCHARQHSDQMICEKCGFIWDVNDPEPPECKTKESSAVNVRDTASPEIQPNVVKQTI